MTQVDFLLNQCKYLNPAIAAICDENLPSFIDVHL